jgi:predicted metalloprotease
MRWKGERQSENVEDRRGVGGGRMAIGGGGLIVILLLGLLFGVNPLRLLDQLQNDPTVLETPSTTTAPGQSGEDETKSFVAVVLAETEDVWNAQFQRMGAAYREPRLVLFTGQVQSACGFASAAVGPFYCPGDAQVYLDLEFFGQLDRLGAPGDFAQGYVIAHEVGHHVQNLLGVSDQVNAMRGRLTEEAFNRLSVRLELQADFYAGVWAHYAERTAKVLEPGDIEEGLRAASAIGDDRLQQRSQGYVVPDAFTHGTSEQRVTWFRRGYESGDPSQGDTFAEGALQ